LIRLYAFLAPDEIPEELVGGTADLLSSVLQPLTTNQTLFNNAITALLNYSLIQRDRMSKTLSIHRLVQAVIQNEMNKTQRERWAELVMRIVSRLFPFNEAAPWTRSQRYLSHALLAVEYIHQWSFTIDEARSLLNSLGVYFDSRGQYNEAEPLFHCAHVA
jgi:post-segregation antitoxin (ccd killing protein)